ncbi:Wzz/FepE/Etk N-terminal domain-containing protein [Nocardioides zeicaulis]|uniref:Wzz/FepE/Etk N-terminal domain-containing protein n=1 Tax=Nocardioides zeicaulis TaxID=1776857 RepID=A0ABV6DZ44_9ACTN
MSHDLPPTARAPFGRALRHHVALVAVLLVLGAVGGWLYAASAPVTYTSTTRVLINPSVGNPFSSTPSSVRQDQDTSLETEAQMVRSTEVLGAVVDRSTGLTVAGVARRLQVSVPPSTQILEISFSADDPELARQVTDAVASAYLANRDARFKTVQDERVGRLETQTVRTVEDLRSATTAAQKGTAAQKAFNNELADALRNELVNLRAQRTALENLTAPAGTVVSPASRPAGAPLLTTLVPPVGGAVAGLVVGCLLALLLERARGTVRSAAEVRQAGLVVTAAVPRHHLWQRRRPEARRELVDVAVRRLRATLLELDPRPDVLAVVGTSPDTIDASAAEALAGSFTRAGHRVVLVRPAQGPGDGEVAVEEHGLAQLLLHERLDVHDVLRPTVEPLLSVLDGGGMGPDSRELLSVERVRGILAPLVEEGHVVVVHVPDADSPDSDAYLGAADLGVVVVSAGRSRRRRVDDLARAAARSGAPRVALVVGPRDLEHRTRPTRDAEASTSSTTTPGTKGASGAGAKDVKDVKGTKGASATPQDPKARSGR